MLETALKIFQIVFSIFLIGAVMMHSAKGSGLGVMGGGGSNVFGSQKGVEEGLNRLTTALVILWGLTSVVLAYISYHK
jgi:protein translocase SecG subunit